MNSEHYLSKIERNANVADKVSPFLKEQFISNIKWARDLSSKLQHLDYDVRDEAITRIHNILDSDYRQAGFKLEEVKSEKRI